MKVLAVDIGTTNVKATVVDEKGSLVKAATRELRLITREKGAAEHSPYEIRAAGTETARLAVKGLDVDAVALTCYQHGLLPVDGSGEPVYSTLTHMDIRSGPYVATVEEACDSFELYKRTGCPPLFVYALPKILWLKRERPDIANRARRFLLVKDFVVMKAVGEPYVDYGNASGSQLFNIRSLRWDNLALEIAGIGEDELATPVEGAKILCELQGKGAELFSVKPGTPLVPGTFDGAGQNFGYTAESFDTAVVNLGTTAVLRLLSKEPVIDSKGMRMFCYYAAAGRWSLGGSTNNGGSVLRWFRDTFGGFEKTVAENLDLDPYDLLVAEAERAPVGAGGLVFLPFMAGERFPFRDPFASGVLLGLRYVHGKGHMIRALMEGVAMVLKAILAALEDNGISPVRLIGGGGGLKSRLWAKIIASATRRPLVRVKGGEYASNKGAAALSLVALGAVNDIRELDWSVGEEDTIQPDEAMAKVYSDLYEKFLEAYGLLRPLFRKWSW
ncbi:MAG: gluconokinase [Thermofilaceae archaeon]